REISLILVAKLVVLQRAAGQAGLHARPLRTAPGRVNRAVTRVARPPDRSENCGVVRAEGVHIAQNAQWTVDTHGGIAVPEGSDGSAFVAEPEGDRIDVGKRNAQ